MCAAACRALCLCNAAQRPIIALRAAARKKDLLRRRADECSRLGARTHDGTARPLSERVEARRIAIYIRQIRHHLFEHAGIKRRRRSIIEIDRRTAHWLHPTR